jgi:hypothetical protein
MKAQAQLGLSAMTILSVSAHWHGTDQLGRSDECPFIGCRKWCFGAVRTVFVKGCGWRPHDGGAADTGAGVRKPPREETPGGVEWLANFTQVRW